MNNGNNNVRNLSNVQWDSWWDGLGYFPTFRWDEHTDLLLAAKIHHVVVRPDGKIDCFFANGDAMDPEQDMAFYCGGQDPEVLLREPEFWEEVFSVQLAQLEQRMAELLQQKEAVFRILSKREGGA